MPILEQKSLPKDLQVSLLDDLGNPIIETTTYQNQPNIKWEFTGTTSEAFSIVLKLQDDYFQENFIL